MKKNATKKALLGSILAIMLCLTMLVGTTFAWFTDTASANVNKIQSGKLDVDIVDATSGETLAGSTLKWQKAAGHETEAVLWEPGCTYTLTPFRIANNGNLNLKYKVVISGATGDTELLNAIEFTYTMGGNTGAAGSGTTVIENEILKPDATSEVITITGKMKTDAGNEYQGKTLDNIAITVLATQAEGEFDSTSDKYDENADFTPDNLDQAVTANVTETVKAGEITVLSNAKDAEKATVTVTVPADTAVAGTELKLSVAPTTKPADLTIDSDKGSKAYEISVEGLPTDNSNAIEVKLYVGKGLSGVKLYHKETEVADADYDAATGFVTFTTTSFSPFTVVYDAVATVNGIGYATLQEAFQVGGNVVINKNVETNNLEDTLAARIIVKNPTTLTLNGMIITPDNMGNNGKNFTSLTVAADTTINAANDETAGINTGSNGAYAINVISGATLTINGGYYYGGGTAVQVQKGTLIINGGHFKVEPYDDPVYGSKFVINCIDAAFKDGTAKISITGGTFVNFDPSRSDSENPEASFVADGYKVVSEAHGSDTWYTVVPE